MAAEKATPHLLVINDCTLTCRLLTALLTAEGYRNADTRRFSLNLRYNFGIRKKEEKSSGVDFPAEQ